MCSKPNKRPTQATAEMRMRAAIKVAADLIDSGDFNESDTPESLAADIVGVRCWERDGYALARELERDKGWSPDEQMVETLGGYFHACDDELSAAEKLWGEENPMEPPLPVGTRVKAGKEEGEIIGIAKYSVHSFAVKVPSVENGYRVVRFEDAEAL
jgi:hypothetical protein